MTKKNLEKEDLKWSCFGFLFSFFMFFLWWVFFVNWYRRRICGVGPGQICGVGDGYAAPGHRCTNMYDCLNCRCKCLYMLICTVPTLFIHLLFCCYLCQCKKPKIAGSSQLVETEEHVFSTKQRALLSAIAQTHPLAISVNKVSVILPESWLLQRILSEVLYFHKHISQNY